MENTSFTNEDAEVLVAEVLPENNSNNGITFSGLDPILGSLGEMVGLLTQADGAPEDYSLNNSWFSDPIGNTRSGFTQNSGQFGELLAQILGKVGGNALGIPVQDPALLGTWYPIKYNDAPTGLYFISYEKGEETVLGVGILHTWTVTPATPMVNINVWGLVPFVRVGKGSVNITFNTPGYPIILGVALEGAVAGTPLIDINDVSFNGVKVSAAIDLASSSPFELSIQVLALKLAGDAQPSDRTLADLEAITGQQILETASSLFTGALSNVFTDPAQQTRISYFPPLLGLTSIVPNSETKMPVLAWYELFKIASNPGAYPNGAATPFLNWFNTLSADPALLKTWLSCLGGFLSGAPAEATGSGSRTDPFAISVISISTAGELNFTVGTEVTGDGERYFYPGISFTGTDIALGTPGASDVVFNMQADLELAKFQLSGSTVSAAPTINFQFKCSLANKTAGEPLAQFDQYSFGSLEGGLSFGLSGNIVPYFYLNEVVTPSSSFDTINLLSPSQLANAGAAVLSDGIKTLLGVSTGNAFSKSVASLIGLSSPDSAGTNWPAALAAPFDAAQMINSITDPLGAWAGYYLKTLQYATPVDGKNTFTYIIQDFGQLLNAVTGTETVTVTGSGTQSDPWMAGITLATTQLPAYLTAYQEALDNGGTRLNIGLSLAPELTLLGTKVVPSIILDVISIDFPVAGSTSGVTANWLPLIAAQLTLPDGFQTPEAGGISIKVDQSQLSASWSRNSGWNWSMFVNNPSLLLNGTTLSLGQDLNFDDQSSLEDLVTKGVATFGPFLVGALGAFLVRTNTRAGLFATGALGLLTDLSKSPVFPAGFKWNGFTQFKITSFGNPWPDIRSQLASDLSTTDKAGSLLSLLSWAIDSSLDEPPAIAGTGTFDDPYKTPIPAGFEIPVWYDATSKVVGLGIGRNDVYNYGAAASTAKTATPVKFRFDLETRVNVIEYSLDTGSIISSGNCPTLSFLGTLSNPDGLLVDLPLDAGSVNKVILGFKLSIVSGQITFEPVVTMLGVTLAGQEEKDQLTLQDILSPDFTASLQSAFSTILNSAIQAAVNQVKDVDGFKTAYDLLSLFGLTTTRASATDPYGINVAGWTGLMSNFDTYIQAQLSSLLTNADSRTTLFEFLESTFDITIPSFPAPLLELFSSLDICGPAEEGYPLNPQALLEIFSNPVDSIKQRFENLFSNTDLLKQLAKELTQNIPPAQYGSFTFSSNSNGVIALDVLPANAFKLGTFIELSGSVQLDIINAALSCNLSAYCPVLGLALNNTLTLRYPLTTDDIYTAAMIWGDGTKPSADPLPLFPFNSDDFLSKLSKLAPAYALNLLSNAILEDGLLNKYPLIQQLFEGLGIAKKAETPETALLTGLDAQKWDMQSIMGILKDPLAWLLSDDVLGYNGKFNVGALASLLSNIPQVSSDSGIALKPLSNGINISGLPYGLGINITGENGLATFSFSADAISIANGLGKLDNLGLNVGLDANYQPAFSGSVDISSTATPVPLFATIGYDKEFLFKISQGTSDKPTGLALQLLPFLGWGNLAGEAASLAAATLIQDLTPKLLDALSKTGAKPFVDKMVAFGTAVDVNDLVTALLAILTPQNFSTKTQAEILNLVETAALGWLKGRFSATQAPVTAAAVKTLLSDVLPTQLTTSGGLVVFAPGADIPVKIKAGLNNNLLGLWAELELPSLKLLDVTVSETGGGIDINTGAFDFSFGLNLLVPVEDTSGPSINLEYVTGTGFLLTFDPMGDSAAPGVNSDMSRELLPEFFPKRAGDPDALSDRMTDWILSIFKNVIPRYISALVLNEEGVHTWLELPFTSDANAPTPALLLEAASLIISTGTTTKKYYLNAIDDLLSITPKAFLGNLLKTLMQNELTLLTFGTDNKSKIKVGPQKNVNGNYGLTLYAPNLKLPSVPNVVLQLGDDVNTDWITKSGGVAGDTGIGLYLPITVNGTDVSADFTNLNLVLRNVGFDIVGTNGKPLVDLSRVQIDSINSRILFDLKLNGGSPNVSFGAGVTLQNIGFSLTPDSLAPGDTSSNPIASNLLGSGDGSSTDNPPTNPTFSVTAAYTTEVYVELKSNTGSGSEVIIPIQRSFGPLFVDNLGLGWENDTKFLDFLFSGSITLAGLKTTLIGLTVGVPTKTPTNFSAYTLDLQGLNISFDGGSVTIDAGLLKQTDPYLCYNGTAVIKGGSFSLLALGSYAEIPVSSEPDAATVPSLFIFGVLNIPLGGPPAFFVTGIAAGFSYNRSIIIPSIENVQSFPLVKGVVDGSFTSNDPINALKNLSEIVKPEIGQYWLAAGLQFKSFELIKSVAILFLSFGKEWEINLLGLSYATLPPDIPASSALAYFELAIKVSFKPTAGIISAEAQLTPNSYVLSTDCKVTGGFAFYLWYKDVVTADYTISAGDFVITLGGYHPAFTKPAWYPDVPRLGMQWKMDISVGKISISGGAYFALCPTAIMAGGYLNVTYELGPLKAWLDAYANFLIEWKPFYFNVGIGITIGVSFGTTIAGVSITIKAELGAKLQLEGPPTHGYIEVDWYVISFIIPVGSGSNATDDEQLTWGLFEESFLPPPVKSAPQDQSNLLMDNEVVTEVQQVVKWSAQSGMQNANTSNDLWIVNPVPFSVAVQSAIPSSLITVAGSGFENTGIPVGVRPMGFINDLGSPLTITVLDGAGDEVDLSARQITMTVITNGAPAALWSKDMLDKQQAPDPTKMLISGAIFGITISADHYVITGDVPAFSIANLIYDRNDIKLLPYANIPPYPAAALYPIAMDSYTTIKQSIMQSSVIASRNAVFAALSASAIYAPAGPDLSVMAFSAELILQAIPVIARIDIYQNGGVPQAGIPIPQPPRSKQASSEKTIIKQPRLQGILKKYGTRAVPRLNADRLAIAGTKIAVNAGLPAYANIVRGKWSDKTFVGRDMLKSGDGVRDATDFITLHDGGIGLWKIDARAATNVKNNGTLPVIVFSFNAHDEMIELRYFNTSAEYTLLPSTAQIAVQGFAQAAGNTIGWQKNTLLSKINPVWAVSEGSLIRVQNSQRIAVPGTGRHTGLIDAEQLLKHNRVQGVNGAEPGWIQSLFPVSCKYIAVMANTVVTDDKAFRVTVLAGKIPLKIGLNAPVKTFVNNGKTVFIYQSPEAKPTDTFFGVIAKSANFDQNIIGMYGLNSLAGTSDEVWNQLSLNYGAFDLSGDDQESSDIYVNSK